jgi:hypothetical protein
VLHHAWIAASRTEYTAARLNEGIKEERDMTELVVLLRNTKFHQVSTKPYKGRMYTLCGKRLHATTSKVIPRIDALHSGYKPCSICYKERNDDGSTRLISEFI